MSPRYWQAALVSAVLLIAGAIRIRATARPEELARWARDATRWLLIASAALAALSGLLFVIAHL
jgi:hypothetical protein